MTEKTMVMRSIRIDADLYRDASELFANLGLSFGGAIGVFLRQALRERAIPFRIGLTDTDGDVYNAETLRTIREARAGIGLSGPHHSVEELMDDLNSDDDPEDDE